MTTPTPRLWTAVLLGVAGLAWPGHTAAQSSGYGIGANFTASNSSESPWFPPNAMGAVGPDQIALLLNGRYKAFDKTGQLADLPAPSQTLNAFWDAAGAGRIGDAFDTRILYDSLSQRWIALSADGAYSGNSGLLLGVSRTSDLADGWNALRWDADPANKRWADFAALGIDRDGVYISAAMFTMPGTTSMLNYQTWVLPTADLLAPSPTLDRLRLFANSNARTPTVALDDSGPASGQPMLYWQSSSGGKSVYAQQLTGSSVSNLTLSPVYPAILTAYQAASNARQPDGSADLYVFNDRFTSNFVRINGSYWGVENVKPGNGANSAVRWFEIVIDPANPGRLLRKQEGLITLPGLDFFYPSISVNDRGDVVIGFTGSGPSTYASSFVAVGSTVNSQTTFSAPQLLKAGTANYHVNVYSPQTGTTRNRWGDYSSTVNDPADPNIFWTFQEWASGPASWSVQASEIITFAAHEFYWASAQDGSVIDAARWMGRDHAPAAGDSLVFSRPNPEGNYTVRFNASGVSDRLSVRQGNVTWWLNPGITYSATGNSPADPSLQVSPYQGESSLRIDGGGTLETLDATLAPALGGRAQVVVAGLGTTWRNTGSVYVGGTDELPGGTASLTLEDGAIVRIGQTLKIWLHGSVDATGGTLEVGHLDIAGGTFTGNAAVTGGLTVSNSTIQTAATETFSLQGALAVQSAPGSSLVKAGDGVMNITGAQSYGQNARVRVDGGTLLLHSSGVSIVDQVHFDIAPRASLRVAGQTDPFTDTYSPTRHATVINDGQFALDPTALAHLAGLTGAGSASVDGGSLTVTGPVAQSSLRLAQQGSFTLAPSDALPGAVPAILVNSFAIEHDGGDLGNRRYFGRLDLGHGMMIIDYDPAETSPLDQVRDMLRSAVSDGVLTDRAWDGWGITSSLAADMPLNWAVGIVDNADLARLGLGYGNGLDDRDGNGLPEPLFHGRAVDDTSLLLLVTQQGDADLDGQITGTDFFFIDTANYLGGPTGWLFGDFDHDGDAGGSADYFLIDNNFLLPLAAPGLTLPEPSASWLWMAVLAGLARRRPRR